MQYYTKTNTADPRIGFITKGEILSEEQVESLGEEKLTELVLREMLGAIEDKQKAKEPHIAPEPHELSNGQKVEESEASDDSQEPEELPELNVGDVICDEPAEAPKKRGGRKTK